MADIFHIPDKGSVSLKNILDVSKVFRSFWRPKSYFFYVFMVEGYVDHTSMYGTEFEAKAIREALLGKLKARRQHND